MLIRAAMTAATPCQMSACVTFAKSWNSCAVRFPLRPMPHLFSNTEPPRRETLMRHRGVFDAGAGLYGALIAWGGQAGTLPAALGIETARALKRCDRPSPTLANAPVERSPPGRVRCSRPGGERS